MRIGLELLSHNRENPPFARRSSWALVYAWIERCRLSLPVLETPEHVALAPLEFVRTPKFSKGDNFLSELKRRVDDYFETTGLSRRDCPQMYLKTALLLASFAGCYVWLVWGAQTWWQALPCAALLGFVTACIGMNVQHDGGHQAFSDRPWVNKLMAMSLDLIGGSSYLWHWKHAVLHHTYVNIAGHDTDIEYGFLARVAPHQPRRSFHRWQHLYLWSLYGLIAVKWHLYDDFRDLAAGRISNHRVPRPTGWELVIFIGGKLIFVSLAFVIPLMFHSVGAVLLFYGVSAFVTGIVLSMVFQLAHIVGEAAFPLPAEETGCLENSWAIHQVETTIDFARSSKLAAWLLGGLNYQVEHHLFPRVCHVHYQALSHLVEATCRDFGVKYCEHKTFWAGIVSHFRWLRQMGMPSAELAENA